VMPISTADSRGGILANREPGLGKMSHLEIVWSSWSLKLAPRKRASAKKDEAKQVAEPPTA
jgi:hypothetical protein